MCVQENETSKRLDYECEVMSFAKALSDMTSGAQILMDAKSFNEIKLQLAELYESIPKGPDIEALQENCR